MKKSLFKLILGVFATVMLFSSCLGDGNSSTERPATFAYITLIDGTQCAAMDGYYFTSTLIRTLSVGNCYILGYRTNYEVYYGNVLLAEDIAQPIALTTTYGRVDSADSMEDTFHPYDFWPEMGAYSEYLGNNCSFFYKTKTLKENDSPRAYCFYDDSRQYEMIDGVRKDVGKNQIIIDVRFNHIPGADGSPVVDTSWRSVVNLSNIKDVYRQSENYDSNTNATDIYVRVDVKFRYNQLQSDGTVKEDVYFGSWTTPTCYFVYEKE